MAGRPRRSRALLGVVLFFLIAIIYYTRAPRESLNGNGADTIGDGSVIRPGKPAEDSQKDVAPSKDSLSSERKQQSILVTSTRQVATTYHSSISHAVTASSVPVAVTHSISSPSHIASTSTSVVAHNPQFYTGQEGELPVPQNGASEPVTTSKQPYNYWQKQEEKFPVTSTIRLPSQTPKALPIIQHPGKGHVAEKERNAVLEAMRHTWRGYRENAWGADELMPVSGQKKNPFNGWGATLVDSLDTLWIMGMEPEFEEAVEAVAAIDFTTSTRIDIPLFEVTIRYLGGLLGGYDVSGSKHTVLLDKAVELAEVLLGAFDTPNRMPQTYYHWQPAFASQPHRASTRVVLAELGSLSVEFTRLAQITKEDKYYDAVARITDALEEMQNTTLVPGMWPIAIDASGCNKQFSSYRHHTDHEKSSAAMHRNFPNSGAVGSPVAFSAEQPLASSQAESQSLAQPLGSSGQPGIGKIAGFDHPIPEGSLDSKDAKDRVLLEVNTHLDKRDLRNTTIIDDGCQPQGLKSANHYGPDTFTLGGQSDSTYEYLPKQYILLGGNVDKYRTMYINHAEAVRKELFFRPMSQDERDILISGQVTVAKNAGSEATERNYQAHSEHLTCFVGGMFAMAGKIFDRPADVDLGAKLTDGCVWAYNITGSGIMPEGFTALACKDASSCPWNQTEYWLHLDPSALDRPKKKKMPAVVADLPHGNASSPSHPDETTDLLKRQLGEDAYDTAKIPEIHLSNDSTQDSYVPDQPYIADPTVESPASWTPPPEPTHEEYVQQKIASEKLPPGMLTMSPNYILRPEAIESVVYMYRITADQYWRDVGWNMFQAIDRQTRTKFGYSAILDVTSEKPLHSDSMESFWTAETLKYFYLLFDDPAIWSLDDWVLNTEAHFLRRPR